MVLLRVQSESLDALRDDNSALRAENERLNERQSVLEAALTTLNERWDAQTAAVREQALDLAAADRKLYRLQQDVSRERESVERLQRDISRLNQRLAAARTPASPTTQTEPKPDPVPAARPTPVPQPQPPRAAPSQPPVLTMRFESTEAIERLIRSGQTVLYGVVGERAWASTPSGAFVRSDKPVRPYQLTESPGRRIINRFRHGSGLVSATKVRWWVTFDDTILRRIVRQISEHTSGELVIDGRGRVEHRPHGVGGEG